uniref:Uncharacterized protein n=1 Tax=Caenorhabditis japonica TaxID=281687 RepID=A0A8R1DWC2_CAEJA
MDEYLETMDGVLELGVEDRATGAAAVKAEAAATIGESTTGTAEEELLREMNMVSFKVMRKRIKGFAKFVASATEVEQQTRQKIAMMTKCSERQKKLILAPVAKFGRELLERFEEMGGDEWPRSVLRVMRKFGLERGVKRGEEQDRGADGEAQGAAPDGRGERRTCHLLVHLNIVQLQLKTGWESWSEVESLVFLLEWTSDGKINKAMGELVEKLALEVTEVTIVQSRTHCTFDEVQKVTNSWSKTWKTAANVQLVDPMSLIGEKRTPLILAEWKYGSWDRLVKFLTLAIPSHRIMARLLKEADVAEPTTKKHKLANDK